MSQTRQLRLERNLDSLSSHRCFSQFLDTDAVEVHAMSPSALPGPAYRYHNHAINSLNDVHNLSSASSIATCMICLHQQHSFRPINTTRDIFQALAVYLDISPDFIKVLSNFYQKISDLEQTYCAPLVTSDTAEYFEYMYVLKYPEHNGRSDGEPWSIRKTAVYHQLKKSNGRSVYVLVSPIAASSGAQALSDWFRTLGDAQSCKSGSFGLNQVLLSNYEPGWRSYATFYEKRIGLLHTKLMSIGLIEVDAVTPDEMADLFFFESKIVPLEVAANATASLCETLQYCSKQWARYTHSTSTSIVSDGETEWLQNHRKHALAYAINASALLTKCERAVQLLDRVLNLKSQQIAEQQNTNILALTKSTVDDSTTIRVITAITLVYLSCTVVATIFSMPFFELEANGRSLSVSSDFWIYVVLALTLTAATIAYWRWSLARKRRQRQLAGVAVRLSIV